MGAYIGKRMMGLVLVLIGITFLSFILSNISTVDPAEAFVRRNAQTPTEEQIQELREVMGLDLPIRQQYFRWVSKAVRGDFGESLVTGNQVIKDIGEKIPATLMLVAVALLLIVIVAIPVGVLCAVYKNSLFDHLIRVVTILGISVPSFWLGFMLLMLFAVRWRLVPVVGYGGIENVILPAFTLAVATTASSIRLLRANMLENTNKDFVVYAKARGISKRKITWKHIFKNATPPLVTLFGQTAGYLLAGTAAVESVFSWPGIGSYAVQSIIARDLPAINVYVLLTAVVFVICNLLADITNVLLNPQMLRESGDL